MDEGQLEARRRLIKAQQQLIDEQERRAEEQERKGLKVYIDIPLVTEAERAERRLSALVAALKARHSKRINRFYEIAELRVSLLDEYGDERWDALDKEVDVVIKKIAQDEARSDGEYPPEYAGLSEFLKQSFRERFNKKLERPTLHGNFSAMTGQDFEAYLMKLLHRLGYTDISGTPVTGDQGADVLATKDGKRIVIQAKNYREPVGNAAVQEVSAAVSFYSGDEGWVVTGSTFTSAAKQLARRCNIRLIDRFDLEKMVADANT